MVAMASMATGIAALAKLVAKMAVPAKGAAQAKAAVPANLAAQQG